MFALAVCGALRDREGFHVVPRLPNRVIAGAVLNYVALEPGEILLAVFDPSNGVRPKRGCALTSRRLCWFDGDTPPDPLAEGEGEAPGPMMARLRGASISYEDLPDPVAVTGRFRPRLALGRGCELAPHGLSGGGFAALAGVLGALGRGARTGDLAGSVAPEALDDARRIVNDVGRLSEAARTVAGEQRTFHGQAWAATPRLLITPFVAGACVLIYAVMVLAGVPAMEPDAMTLFRWGGGSGAAVAVDGDYWRLFTAMFLHVGLLHLVFNMWCLSRIGPLIERLYGNLGFALLYVIAGLGSSLASAWWNPLVVGVGASGAIFGVIGGLLAFLVLHHEAIPASVLGPLRSSTLAFVAYNVLPGFLSSRIDNAAHLGGLATGFVAGLILSPPWPAPGRGGLVRLAARSGVVLLGLGLTGLVVNDHVRRDPEVVALTRSVPQPLEAYTTFMASMKRPMAGHNALIERIDALVGKIRNGGVADDAVRRELDRLLIEALANRSAAETVAASDSDLAAMRQTFLDAETHLIRQIRAFRSYADDHGDATTLKGPDGYFTNRTQCAEAIARLDSQIKSYFARHGIAPVPGPKP